MQSFENTTPLSSAEKIARLRLIRTNTVGPITYRHLLTRYGSALKALEEIAILAEKGQAKKALKIPTKTSVEREIEDIKSFGGSILYLGDASYPKALAASEDAPPVLFAKGHTHLLEKETIGIVGARNASAAGLRLTTSIAKDLGDAGLVVASGLARGIDTAAHTASLETGTVACVAGGLDYIYPPENKGLYEKIIQQGLMLSEMPLGTQPQARHFPRRNRLISGLSLGVLVVEAAHRSGSLITARLANEQGREVFAVPGSPLDPRSKGTNGLIQNGAKLTQSAEDILSELADMRRRPLADPAELPLFSPNLNSTIDTTQIRPMILDLLSPTPMEIDEIIRLCEQDASAVLSVILELELAGVAVRYPGNKVSLL